MQILNFTEQQIKPALQDKSKCFMIRKAWNWAKEWNDKARMLVDSTYKWFEQLECRHNERNI